MQHVVRPVQPCVVFEPAVARRWLDVPTRRPRPGEHALDVVACDLPCGFEREQRELELIARRHQQIDSPVAGGEQRRTDGKASGRAAQRGADPAVDSLPAAAGAGEAERGGCERSKAFLLTSGGHILQARDVAGELFADVHPMPQV